MKALFFKRLFRAAWLLTLLAGPIGPAQASDDLWVALRAGTHVAMMRHALAPGTGDPGSFVLDDCSTQRNLNDVGRKQAAKIGARFRARGIATARVYSSQWCRCVDTAELLGLGTVTPLPALNSFFQDRGRGPAQTAALKSFLAGRTSGEPAILVTHQVNITALTGIFPTSGEIVVVRVATDGAVDVAGRIAPDEE